MGIAKLFQLLLRFIEVKIFSDVAHYFTVGVCTYVLPNHNPPPLLKPLKV